MPAPVLASGLDARALLLDASVLRRQGQTVEEIRTTRGLVQGVAEGGVRLVVLGPQIQDSGLPEAIQKLRHDPATRRVSILVVIPSGADPALDGAAIEAGANAVLRRPFESTRLDHWVAKLLYVPRRARARVPVQGQVVGTPRFVSTTHFIGLTHNISVNGLLLASPVALGETPDLDLEINLIDAGAHRALARVVRRAPEVAWPYLGYGVEFLYLPQGSQDAIVALVERESAPIVLPSLSPLETQAIRATIRRESWVYEILEPVGAGDRWQVEIRRSPRDHWRAGSGGPFYVVEDSTPETTLEAARTFIRLHG